MLGECHAHLFMDGKNYRHAVELHRNGVQEWDVREKLKQYQEKGITFLREGGDVLGVSTCAARLAPEYGITYCSPVFAIHKNGHYGGIVGYGFDSMKEYAQLVRQAGEKGADFIKVMFSGIMDFSHEGHLTEEPLDRATIREMIHIAHEEGFAVMAHVNGAAAVLAAVEGGVDSVEHGNFMDEDCLQALAESHAVWVPTYVTITNLIGSGRFDDAALRRLKERQGEKIRRGYALGAALAAGSDAGAFRVPHGQGLLDEYRELRRLLAEEERQPGKNGAPKEGRAAAQGQARANAVQTDAALQLDARLAAGEAEIRRRFFRH